MGLDPEPRAMFYIYIFSSSGFEQKPMSPACLSVRGSWQAFLGDISAQHRAHALFRAGRGANHAVSVCDLCVFVACFLKGYLRSSSVCVGFRFKKTGGGKVEAVLIRR